MEKGTSPPRYTDLEKEELIEQWKQSGKNKVVFCRTDARMGVRNSCKIK